MVFNLLTALVGRFPSKRGVVSMTAGKVINGTITRGRPGHIIFHSLSACLMTFPETKGCLLFLHAGFFNGVIRMEVGGGG